MLGTASTSAHAHHIASHRPGIPPRRPLVPLQHPSTRSHAPPPTVCICIACTIASAVDTSKQRLPARAQAHHLGPQGKKHRLQASELGAQAKTLCVRGSATPSARCFARHAKCGNSAPKAFSAAPQVRWLARKARQAARKPNGFARKVPALGVPSNALCMPSKKADMPSKTLRTPRDVPRPPQSASEFSAAETRAPAASGCTLPAGTHTPPNVSGPSASTPGVPPVASRASAVVSGARRKTARGPESQRAVRQAMWAAHEAHRADLRPKRGGVRGA